MGLHGVRGTEKNLADRRSRDSTSAWQAASSADSAVYFLSPHHRLAHKITRQCLHADWKEAIGSCYGGIVALKIARNGVDVAGVVSFAGGWDAPAPAEVSQNGCLK